MSEDTRFPEEPTPEGSGVAMPDVEGEEEGADIPDDAFYSPDDPIARPEGDIPDDAIFSPDDPIAREDEDLGEGVVTGIGGTMGGEYGVSGNMAYELRHAANIMDALAKAIKEQGVEALRVHPETEPVDAMLRSFVAGFIVGRTDLIE